MRSTSWETLGWEKYKLESRLPGEISTHCGRKRRRTKDPFHQNLTYCPSLTTSLEQSLRATGGAVHQAVVLILPQIKLNSQLSRCASFLVDNPNGIHSLIRSFSNGSRFDLSSTSVFTILLTHRNGIRFPPCSELWRNSFTNVWETDYSWKEQLKWNIIYRD